MKNANIFSKAQSYGMVALATLCLSATSHAQNFSKIYDALPDMTLDQSYSALIDFQKANPYFSNTYIQLGNVSEKKMILYDPLREISTVQFWAGNAKLFYGNLKVYYKEGDCRSEFFENLNIPYSGKRITDEDMWRFVNEHLAACKNYSDTTTLIYSAIESSRKNYNQCIEEFTEICNEYKNLNDLLLRHDDKLAKKLTTLKTHIDECEKQFAEYKRLTKLFPIADYRQLYEKQPIETYRLDGLTNSDFFNNRFTIWDYSKWVDEVEKDFTEHIKPLRSEVEAINKAYAQAREKFSAGDILQSDAKAPYDEFFLYKLEHYDVGSLIEPLFDYLESTRQMTLMAGDSIGRDAGTDMTLESRKMRRLSQLAQQQSVAADKRKVLSNAITSAKIMRFKDFFVKEYGGTDGLREFLVKDDAYCQTIVDAMSEATAAYLSRVSKYSTSENELYSSAAGAAAPALPLWVTMDPQSIKGKYVTTHTSRGSRGEVAAVAGYAKANAKNWFVAGISDNLATQYVLQLKNVNSVSSIRATADGVLVSALRSLKPVIIYVNTQGKEVAAVPTTSEIIDVMERDGVSGSIVWIEGNDKQTPTMSLAQESATVATWTTQISGLAKALSTSAAGDGYVVTGISTEGELAYAYISTTGQVRNFEKIQAGVEDIISSIRVSSDEIGVLAKMKTGANKYIAFKLK